MTASLSHCVVYTLLLAALTAFDENTLTRNAEEMQVGDTLNLEIMDVACCYRFYSIYYPK